MRLVVVAENLWIIATSLPTPILGATAKPAAQLARHATISARAMAPVRLFRFQSFKAEMHLGLDLARVICLSVFYWKLENTKRCKDGVLHPAIPPQLCIFDVRHIHVFLHMYTCTCTCACTCACLGLARARSTSTACRMLHYTLTHHSLNSKPSCALTAASARVLPAAFTSEPRRSGDHPSV